MSPKTKKSVTKLKKVDKAYASLQPKYQAPKKKIAVSKRMSTKALVPKATMHKVGKSLAVSAVGTELASRVMTG